MTLPPRSRTSPASPGLDVALAASTIAHLEARARPPHRGGDRLGIVASDVAHAVPASVSPYPVTTTRERQLLVDPADQLDGDVGRPGHRHPQAGEVVVVALRVVEDGLVQRRGARAAR